MRYPDTGALYTFQCDVSPAKQTAQCEGDGRAKYSDTRYDTYNLEIKINIAITTTYSRSIFSQIINILCNNNDI